MLSKEEAEQIASELHKPIRHKHPRRKVIVHSLDSIWGADLCEMKVERGYKYILTVIDIWSKYAWGVSLKSKDGRTVSGALENIFNTSNRVPEFVWTDKGKEFYNSHVKSLFEERKVKLYSTESELKSIVVERLNRTLKEKMEKQFTIDHLLGKKSSWLAILPIIVEEYNNTVHSKIQCTPVNAIQPEWQTHVAKRMREDDYEVRKHKFKIGDRVRIYKWKPTFEKGYKSRWTSEVFTVSQIHDTLPVTYTIKDSKDEEITGRFYDAELLKSETSDHISI